MKLFATYFILLALGSSASAQDTSLTGFWYSSGQDYIEFSPNYWTMASGKTLLQTGFTIFNRTGDRLRFLSQYYDSRDDNKLKTDLESNHDFILKERGSDYIVLEPSSALSKEFFDNRNEIRFMRREKWVDSTIQFEKLIFHTAWGSGTWPERDIQIDKNRKIFYTGQLEYDSVLSGNFSGTITKEDADTINQLLRNCQLRTQHWKYSYWGQAPMITLIIYFNDERRYFQSTYPPQIAFDLIAFLYRIHAKASLS